MQAYVIKIRWRASDSNFFFFFLFSLLCTSADFIIMMQVLGELYSRYSPTSPSSCLSLGRLEVVNTQKFDLSTERLRLEIHRIN